MFEIILGDKLIPADSAINSRTAVRGVIADDKGYLLILTNKGDYKFPGGGIHPGESDEQALRREILEETGYPVSEFGGVVGTATEQNADQLHEKSFFVMKSIYIECQIDQSQQQLQNLDQYEHEQAFTPVFVSIEAAIENNLKLLAANSKDINRWVRRDTEVMMLILQQMDEQMIGICGAYCGVCEWKDKMNCPGCRACQGRPFWGECLIARCAIDQGFSHCGFCPNLPCAKLQAAFDDPEHGDHGERLINLQNWADGRNFYLKLRL